MTQLVEDLAVEVTTQVGPWAMVPAWVLQVGLTPGEVVVYVALRTFANQVGAAHPKTSTIALRAGTTPRTVERAVARFRELGLIRTTRRHRADGGLAGLTYLLRDTPPTPPSGGPDTTVGTPPTEVSVAPPTEVSEQEHPRREHPTGTPHAAHRAAVTEADFDSWYQHYPRKQDKGHARKAYRAARKKVSAETLLAAVQAYASDPNLSVDRTKIPYPATWLNGDRWEDGPLPAPTDGREQMKSAWDRNADQMTAYERAVAEERQQRLALTGPTSPWDR